VHKKTPAYLDPLFEAYRAAKATHDAAIHALNAALKSGRPPDPELVREQIEAATREIAALDALRAIQASELVSSASPED
jgi:hypothetical protein